VTDLLLDTHIALWLDSGDDRLGTSRRTIERTWQEGGRLFLSAVSVWEIAVLVDKRFIELDLAVAAWVERFVGRPGIEALSLDHKAAALAYNLGDFDHRDPADRFLIATAIGHGCALVTHDDRIVRFAKGRGKQLGFVVA
jgi:PIN domain nuclease of toxin-antitoxin system